MRAVIPPGGMTGRLTHCFRQIVEATVLPLKRTKRRKNRVGLVVGGGEAAPRVHSRSLVFDIVTRSQVNVGMVESDTLRDGEAP